MAIAGYNSALPVLIVAFVSLTTAVHGDNAQGTVHDEVSRFVGSWRGNSSCIAKGTSCRDEAVVYRITELPEKSGYVSVAADKLVNGRSVNMGTFEFRYDRDQRTLVCEYSQGVWRFKLQGEKMEGTLTTPDNSIFRRVTLGKEP